MAGGVYETLGGCMSAGDGGVGDGMGGNVLAEAQFCGEWEVDKTGVCNEEVFSNGG